MKRSYESGERYEYFGGTRKTRWCVSGVMGIRIMEDRNGRSKRGKLQEVEIF